MTLFNRNNGRILSNICKIVLEKLQSNCSPEHEKNVIFTSFENVNIRRCKNAKQYFQFKFKCKYKVTDVDNKLTGIQEDN